MDLALLLGKMYPSEIKKIIKKMKTKQIIEWFQPTLNFYTSSF